MKHKNLTNLYQYATIGLSTRGDQNVLQLDTLNNKLIILLLIEQIEYFIVLYRAYADEMIAPFVVMTS